jgi:MFS family permease
MFGSRRRDERAIGSTLRESDPAVRWLLFGVFVNQLGAFVQVFLVLFLVDNGVSQGHAGLALGAYGAGSVLGALLGGRLADQLGRRTTMTVSMLCAAGLTISISFLGDPALYLLLLLVVVADGAMTQAYRPAASAMLADLVSEDRLVMTFSLYRVALNTGAVIGPLVAAWLMTISWDLLFQADGVTAIACALLARRFLPGPEADAPAPAGAEAARRGEGAGSDGAAAAGTVGYRAVLRDGRYLLFLFAMFASAVIYMQYFSVLPLQIREHGHSALVYSAILALSAGAVITCELLVTTRVQAWRATTAATTGIALLAAGLGGYGIDGGLVVLFAATLVGVLGQIVSGPTMFAHYAGASQAMFGLGAAIGPLLGVLAFDAIGSTVWALCAAVGALAAAAAFAGMRDPAPARRRSLSPATTGASS